MEKDSPKTFGLSEYEAFQVENALINFCKLIDGQKDKTSLNDVLSFLYLKLINTHQTIRRLTYRAPPPPPPPAPPPPPKEVEPPVPDAADEELE